jgi:hypothetical protein
VHADRDSESVLVFVVRPGAAAGSGRGRTHPSLATVHAGQATARRPQAGTAHLDKGLTTMGPRHDQASRCSLRHRMVNFKLDTYFNATAQPPLNTLTFDNQASKGTMDSGLILAVPAVRLRVCSATGAELPLEVVEGIASLWERVLGAADPAHNRFMFSTPSSKTDKLISSSNTEQWARDTFFYITKESGSQEHSSVTVVAAARLRSCSILVGSDSFQILGIADVACAAAERGQGHGKALVLAMVKYAERIQVPAVGFCATKNAAFYAACGLSVLSGACCKWLFFPHGSALPISNSCGDSDVIICGGFAADALLRSIAKHEEDMRSTGRNAVVCLSRPHW